MLLTNIKKNLILFGLLTLTSLGFSVEKTAVQIKKEYGKAVVMIATYKEGKDAVGLGSGFIVSENGIIITNYQVIEGAYPAVIKLLNGDIYKDISVINYDASKDIAVIKIEGRNLPKVSLGNSDSVDVGEKVYVIGNPEGLENSVSDGLLSGIRETGKGYKLHQISAPISRGSSGSPVFNSQGKVIGVAASTIVEGQNLNFSVPINYVINMISDTTRISLEEFVRTTSQRRESFTEVISKLPFVQNNDEIYLSSLDPTATEELLLFWGAAQTNLKKYDDAIKTFKMVLVLNPKNQTTYRNLAVCYREKGEVRKAYEILQEGEKIKKQQ